jgi:hypothetical protein
MDLPKIDLASLPGLDSAVGLFGSLSINTRVTSGPKIDVIYMALSRLVSY